MQHISLSEKEKDARVLVVDDDIENLNVLTRILRRAGLRNVHGLSQAALVMETLELMQPHLVVLDLHMPGVDGTELIAAIKASPGGEYLPVLVLTGDSTIRSRDAALAAGAKDFITKPYESSEILLRIRNLIETRLLYAELQRQNALLQERFVARTEELEAAKVELLERLARASDFRDEVTHAHTSRVGDLAALLARRLGLQSTEVEQLRIAARLHDIGKIGLSDSILQKPGPLAPAEFRAQEEHTVIGANILSGSRFPILRVAEEVALTHHESWNGTGYPRQLAGEDIPLVGRIVAVADVFDALTHERPYKRAWTVEAAAGEIQARSGTKFDPHVVAAFFAIMENGELNELLNAEVDGKLELLGSHAEPQRARIVRDVVGGRALG
jgi:putative two-component system response regulator